MAINKQFCSTHSSGKEIFEFNLTNSRNTEVVITNYGAIISAFKVRNEVGSVNDIVLGFENAEGYTAENYISNYPWMGCAVGRNGNRIKNAEFEIDGKKYSVSKNIGRNQLHGGFEGFDKKVWELVNMGESPVTFLELKYISPDGEEGYPGTLEVTVRFELTEENELSYQYTAISDKPTVINLTHHGYFNLNNGKGTIHNYELKIYGSYVLDQDDDLVTTGTLTKVKNTEFDFHNFTRIGDRLAQVSEYDKSYVADKNDGESALSLMAEVRSPESMLLLQVYSTEPVVHFYTGKWLPALKGKNGTNYGSFSGFCLETQVHPNAINIPHFPNTILRPGEVYSSKTIYKVIN